MRSTELGIEAAAMRCGVSVTKRGDGAYEIVSPTDWQSWSEKPAYCPDDRACLAYLRGYEAGIVSRMRQESEA